ncbi:ankyrin repeat domain-containing protein [Sansalvadorimonas verongulae]|uniref:ankyrin repeat domain-containing protein n=1 Tax=Sansalvadorimonas verongulae TaxID=2172824 RepID=UPI0012BB98B6|nr:ankyrin repeat domain-containing protein [Sansalvadorimonas verongulae]MTI14071.1 ankyrin repeat domain-containing protein [Sansalvadorimonas verongulae]
MVKQLNSLVMVLLTATSLCVTAGFADDNTLDQQIIPDLRNSETFFANKRVEETILKAWQDQYQQIMDTGNIPRAVRLLNAPISGETAHRGRHLLSFSAFAGFKKLAAWGLRKGADINRGDKDNATMLRMSVANQLPYMVKFALDNGANPNWLQGQGKRNTFGDMMNFSWPLSGFELAWENGARLQNEEQRDQLIAYLKEEHTDPSWKEQARLKYFIDRLESPEAMLPPNKPVLLTSPGQPIDIYMIGVMSDALTVAMKSGDIGTTDIINFNVHGMPLAHFTTFNGMTGALQYILENIPKASATYQVKRRDRTGNDLITAAIKSLNVEALRMVLSTSSETINTKTPSLPVYYSQGHTPLHIAVMWEAPDEMFSLLFEYGAAESLNITNNSGLTPMDVLEQWYSDSPHYERIKKALTR